MDELLARRIARLTDRQQRLLRLTAGGAAAAALAMRLDLAPSHIQRELAALLRALGVRSTAEAALLWWGSRAGSRADVRRAAQALIA
jgi:DNA-binding NarL/FixJ family response regulator